MNIVEFTDPNFGMYRNDVKIFQHIRSVQDKYISRMFGVQVVKRNMKEFLKQPNFKEREYHGSCDSSKYE